MSDSPVDYLRKHPLPEDFKRELVKLGGSFNLDTEDMLTLGDLYFELYPEARQHRNNEHVLAGYEIVRIAIFEKLMEDFPVSEKTTWWQILKHSADIEAHTVKLLEGKSVAELQEEKQLLEKRLKAIQKQIEALPRGEVRERFMGGVAVFPNTLYLFRLALEKLSSDKGQGQ